MYTRNPHDLWMFELVLEGENSQNRHQTDSISIYTYLYRDISIFVIYSDLMYIYIYIWYVCTYYTRTYSVPSLFLVYLFHTWSIFQHLFCAGIEELWFAKSRPVSLRLAAWHLPPTTVGPQKRRDESTAESFVTVNMLIKCMGQKL